MPFGTSRRGDDIESIPFFSPPKCPNRVWDTRSGLPVDMKGKSSCWLKMEPFNTVSFCTTPLPGSGNWKPGNRNLCLIPVLSTELLILWSEKYQNHTENYPHAIWFSLWVDFPSTGTASTGQARSLVIMQNSANPWVVVSHPGVYTLSKSLRNIRTVIIFLLTPVTKRGTA